MNIESAKRADLYSALSRLETALETADLWEDERPPASELESEQPFCYDTLEVHQWLQWRFIPKLRALLDQDAPLPETCAIYPYAEEYLDAGDARHEELLETIALLDALISDQPRAV